MDHNETSSEPVAVASSTMTTTEPAVASSKGKTKRLILKVKEKEKKKIVWCQEVVDNEHMCKKSSKSKFCDIIYQFIAICYPSELSLM
jgi:hypothetical protein